MYKRTKWSVAGVIVLAIVIIGVTSAMKGRNKATEVRIEKGREARSRRFRDGERTGSAAHEGRSQRPTSAGASSARGQGRRHGHQGPVPSRDRSVAVSRERRASGGRGRERAVAGGDRRSPTLSQAQRNYDRLLALKKANPTLVSDEQVEQLKTQVEVAQAQLGGGQQRNRIRRTASLRDAQSELRKTTIFAPMSGRVTRLNVREGETAIRARSTRTPRRC